MGKRNSIILMGDFETTVYTGQVHTEVWASAVVELGTEDVKIFHSIDETYEYLVSLNSNVIIYYHNLKFDGNFWLSYLMYVLEYKQAFETDIKEPKRVITWKKDIDMPEKSYKYSISDMGSWYTIKIKINRHIIEIRDSLKLLPFSVKRIGESFKTKHKKLDMEYEGFRYAGCTITDEEKEYIANDVLVVAEALQIMYDEGHNKLTIGSCCLSEYKKLQIEYKHFFPDLYAFTINKDTYGSETVGDYVHRSYRGGWCYLVKGKEGKIFEDGTTADVNSLYPSVMSSESGSKYPVGNPTFWSGNFIPDGIAGNTRTFFFIRVKTRFYIKNGMLPFIQLKNNALYIGTENLESSDVWDIKNDRFYTEYTDTTGKHHDTRVVMTFTEMDYYLFMKHYNVVDFEILDGCYFKAEIGIFDEYINKYKKLKQESKGARRELAKLFLNNLYGKMAASTNSSFKVIKDHGDGTFRYETILEHNKEPGYIPVGSAITSYARCFTITAAQANYYGVDNPGFIYADTDSIHCDLQPDEIVGIKVHDKDFCCWKLESGWDIGWFARQKTYIEHVVEEDGEECTPYWNIKCAGMPSYCKDLFKYSMEGLVLDGRELTEEQKEFIKGLSERKLEYLKTPHSLSEFRLGMVIPGKLKPKRIQGGVVLVEEDYTMRR